MTSAVIWIIIFNIFFNFSIIKSQLPTCALQDPQQCTTFDYSTELKNLKNPCTQIYILDLSSEKTDYNEFEDIKYFFKESIKSFFDDNLGELIKITTINGKSQDGFLNIIGFYECPSFEKCSDLIDYLNLNNINMDYAEDLIFTDIDTVKEYTTNLSNILEMMCTCEANFAILLTNRIVFIDKNNEIDFPSIFTHFCIHFSVILFGRNESDAMQELQAAYDLPEMTDFNVPDYKCAANLTACLYSNKCATQQFDNCRPIPTLPPPTGVPIDAFHLKIVLAFTINFTQEDLEQVLSSFIETLQDINEQQPIDVTIIISATKMISQIESVEEFSEYVENIRINETEIDLDEKEFFIRIQRAILETQTEDGDERRITLLTNYFPFSNMSVINSMNIDYEMLTFIYLKIYVYELSAYMLYEENNITSYYFSNFSSPIPTDFNFTSSTTTSSTSSIVASTTTTTTTGLSTIYTTTDPKGSSQNDNKDKILFIVFGCIFAGIIIILCLCLIIYRRHLRQKKLEKIRLTHQKNAGDEWEFTWDKLLLKGEQLGSGAYGQVLQGKILEIHKTKNGKSIEENKEVAIKILQRYTNELAEKNFLNEIQIMKQITGHQNIVEMIGCITVGDRICLILEFCPYRDLLQYVKKGELELLTHFQTSNQIQKEFLIFAWQISQGMQYLASEGIIHRDLAARNILIDEFKIAKISDFGLCVKINDKLKNSPSKNALYLETGKLPLKWLAIESLKEYEFSLQSDVWSFGMVLYEMYSFGEIPFAEIDHSELTEHLNAGNRQEKPEFCPDAMYEIMTKCWNRNPMSRPLFDELITIFTVFLEHATENYGYLDVLKSEKDHENGFEKSIF